MVAPLRVTLVIFACAFVLQASRSAANDQPTREEFEAKLGYEHGTITLRDGLATIQLPGKFRFLAPEGSRRLLVDAWGNPPESANNVLGMMVPGEVSPLTPEGWAVVITYEEQGFVNDKDAGSINYDKLLQEMQESVKAASAEREKQGFQPLTLVGWAEPPHYDARTHKMYWAKELAFGGESSHTVNYNIRILGRRGVLVLNAVASMGQLPVIRRESGALLAAVDFNGGHRYTDYLPGKDKAATYGLAGLVLGATAAKAGFFKLLWVGILAFKKVIVVGAIALFALIKRFFAGRTVEESEVAQP
jgi:uncharacterized membrane-anchored protein